jgi:hypothetical protein
MRSCRDLLRQPGSDEKKVFAVKDVRKSRSARASPGQGRLFFVRIVEQPHEIWLMFISRSVRSAGYHGYGTSPDVVCVWMDSGRVKCWGREFPNVPTEVAGLEDAVNVATGYFHVCALLQSGSVNCWGDNTVGYGSVPEAIAGLTNPVQVTAHRAHSCALVDSGRVKCWGHNWFGQLGDGTLTDNFTPVEVVGLTDVSYISPGGDHHTCAVLHSGEARCWGRNVSGQLGDGTTTDRTTPTDVLELSGAVQIASGAGYTCALLETEDIKCWGANQKGQLGDGC